MSKWIVYTLIFLLGWKFGSLLYGEKAYNIGLKTGKVIKKIIGGENRRNNVK